MSPLELAEHYVNETAHSLFLTGKAGTGKTTFLRHIVATTHKRHVVLAPTGVAAINAAGVTIHSFFQLPFCPYLPDVPELVTEYHTTGRYSQLRKNKIDIIRTLELLIIDEVSMVRADLLDAIDATLRRVRRSSHPFGGIQLLLIGDLHQLAPVVTDDERPYIEQVYSSPYFFCSKALRSMSYDIIELTQVFRQQDALFVDLLNQVRSGHPDATTLQLLNARLQKDCNQTATKKGIFAHFNFRNKKEPEPILLTTHNHQADRVNQMHLDALRGCTYTFDAIIEGNFPQGSAPVDSHLVLKTGARVMFLKNDSLGSRQYYNGKMGVVSNISISDETPQIEVTDDDGESIVIGRERWENIRYVIDSDNGIRKKIDGVFLQVPLRLAWAVTIHKAQGLTFDRVAVDASEAFTYGQVYVALSRCRNLEGLTLRSPISSRCVPDNVEVDSYYQSAASVDQLSQSLDGHRQQYRLMLVKDLFDVQPLKHGCERLDELFRKHLQQLYPAQAKRFHQYSESMVQLGEVSERFAVQLTHLIANGDEVALNDRIAKACRYYIDVLTPLASDWNEFSSFDIDNKEVARQYADVVQQISQQLRVRIQCFNQVLKNGFSVNTYQHTKVKAMLADKENKLDNKHISSSEKKENVAPADLVYLLKEWRLKECKRKNVPAFQILSQRALMGIAATMPTSFKQLQSVYGVGAKIIENYGKIILDIVADYRESQGL